MNPLYWLWLLSITGGAIFLLAGYVAGRAWPASASSAPEHATGRQASRLPERLETLQQMLEEGRDRERELEHRLAELQTENAALQTENDAWTGLRDELRRELAERDESLRQAKLREQELEDEIDGLEVTQNARPVPAAELVQEIARLQRREEELLKQAVRAEEELSAEQAARQSLEQGQARLQAEIERLQADAAAGAVHPGLEKREKDHAAREQHLRTELGKEQKRSHDLGTELARLASEHKRLQTAEKEHRSRELVLSSELAKERQRSRDLDAELGRVDDERKRLAERESERAARERLLKGDLVKQQKLVRELEAKLAEIPELEGAAAELERTREDLARAEAEIVRLQAGERAAEEQRRRLQMDLEAARSALEAETLRAAAAEASASGAFDPPWEPDPPSHRDRDSDAAKEVHELRVRLGQAESRSADYERIRAENQALREEQASLLELREAAQRLAALEALHKELKLTHELVLQRLHGFEEHQEERHLLLAQVEELSSEAGEARRLKERVGTLEARLFALGDAPSSAVRPGAAPAQNPRLARGLVDLVEPGVARSAVLADRNGLSVEVAGDEAAHEGLAAITGLAETLAAHAPELLPLAKIDHVCVRDENATVISCHLFDCNGDTMAVATLGPGLPDRDRVSEVIWGFRRAVGQLGALDAPAHISGG